MQPASDDDSKHEGVHGLAACVFVHRIVRAKPELAVRFFGWSVGKHWLVP